MTTLFTCGLRRSYKSAVELAPVGEMSALRRIQRNDAGGSTQLSRPISFSGVGASPRDDFDTHYE